MLAATLITLLPLLAGSAIAAPLAFNKRYTNVRIESVADAGLCLTVDAPAQAGSHVYMGPCDNAIGWDINLGSGPVFPVLTPSGLALDGGPNAGAYTQLTVENSVPGQFSQTFYLTADRHIAITDGNACMSVPGYNEGDAHMTGEVFLGPCITGNAYQVFDVVAY